MQKSLKDLVLGSHSMILINSKIVVNPEPVKRKPKKVKKSKK